jgi:hypothetical protein
MSSTTPQRTTQLGIAVLIGLLVVPSTLALGAPVLQESSALQRHSHFSVPQKLAQQSPPGQQPQTLTITSPNGSGEYALRVTESVQYLNNSSESGDIIQGQRMSGEVGSQNAGSVDTKDVIQFTGSVAQFRAGTNITIALNGQRIPRDVLSGHYIRLVAENKSSTQTRYAFTSTGAVGPASTADTKDGDTVSKNGSTVTGVLAPGDQDVFYYSGKIRRSTIDGPARVFIDGKQVSVDTPQAPQPTVTATPTPETETPPTSSNSTATSTGTTTPLPIGNNPYTVSNLSVSSENVVVGKPVTITVRVANTKNKRIEAPVRLATEGTIASEKSVALFPGNWRQVQFQHTFSSPGQYTIRIGETQKTIRVQERSQPAGGNGVGGFGLRTVAIVIVGSLVVGIGGVRLLQRFS